MSVSAPTPLPASRPSRVVVEAVAPARRRRRLPGQGDGRRTGDRARRRVHRRPRPRRRRAARSASAARRWREMPMAPLGNDRFAGHVRARPARALAVPGRRLARPPRHVAPRHGAQAGRRGRRHRRPADRARPARRGRRRGKLARRRRRARRAAPSGSRPATRGRSASSPSRTTAHVDGHVPDLDDVEPEHDGAGIDLDALFWRTGVREPAAELARPLDVEVDPERARFSAWYEFFPRSTLAPGRPATARWPTPSTASTTSPRWASTSLYLPPVHPIGAHAAQGPQQHRHRRRRRRRQPVGDRRGRGRPHRRAPRARHRRRRRHARRRVPRPRHRAGARHRLPVHARPPVGHRAPGVVRAPARRHDPVRREPAQEVPGHLPARLRERRTGRALWTALADVDPLLDRRRASRSFRVDNPHTKAFAFWEWVIADDPQRAPRGDLPGRGVHPPAGDGAARQGRLHPVVHVLHVAPVAWELREYFERPGRRGPSTTSAPTPGRTRPTSSPSSCSTAAARCSSAGPILAATLSPAGASTARRSSCCEHMPVRPGSRGVPRLREVPGAPVGPRTGPTAWPRCSAASTAIRREQPALAHLRTLRFHDTDNPALLCYSKTDPAGVGAADPRRRQPRRRSPPDGLRRRRPRSRSACPTSRPTTSSTSSAARTLPLAAARATSSTSTRRSRRRTSSASQPVDESTDHEPTAGRRRTPTARSARDRRTGTATPSSTSSTCARSPTPTATASATSTG